MEESLLTKNDLQAIADLLDKQTAVLATKEELEAVRSEMVTKQDLNDLKEYMIEGFESVMEGVNDLVGVKPKI